MFLALVLLMVLHCIFGPYQDKAHYEGVMEMKVLAPIQITESELTDLQKLHQVIALSLAISLCSGHLFFFCVNYTLLVALSKDSTY